jgi:hypothetical protein
MVNYQEIEPKIQALIEQKKQLKQFEKSLKDIYFIALRAREQGTGNREQ